MSAKKKRYRSGNRARVTPPPEQRESENDKSPEPPGSFSALLRLLTMHDKLAALDGYSNSAAFLGEESPLISSGTFKRSDLSRQTELLTTMYRESWLAMRIIDMPSEDMTRNWYKLNTELEAEDIAALRKLEAKHSIRQELANAIRWARLYGGSLALMAIRGDENRLEEPLVLEDILPGSFQGLLVLDRTMGLEPSLELVSDLEDPDFGLPMYYTVQMEMENQRVAKIHHSRVIRFVGRELPYTETVAESYWGASEMEHIWDELQKRNATSANIAQLVFQANVTVLKMGKLGERLTFGTDGTKANILAAIEQENRLRTSYGLQLLSADDSMENHSYSFGGLSEIYEQFMMDICGAAEIPATKLFGRSPSGLNSTGAADLKNYYELISQLQERMLRPALEKLLPVMALSCWGFLPEELEIVFEPVAAITPEERANLVSKISDPILRAWESGLITRQETVAELKAAGSAYGLWAHLQE